MCVPGSLSALEAQRSLERKEEVAQDSTKLCYWEKHRGTQQRRVISAMPFMRPTGQLFLLYLNCKFVLSVTTKNYVATLLCPFTGALSFILSGGNGFNSSKRPDGLQLDHCHLEPSITFWKGGRLIAL